MRTMTPNPRSLTALLIATHCLLSFMSINHFARLNLRLTSLSTKKASVLPSMAPATAIRKPSHTV
jgi:hypothetical protein